MNYLMPMIVAAFMIGSAFAQTGQCPGTGCTTTIPPPPVCTVTSRACVISTAGKIVSCADSITNCPTPPQPPTVCASPTGLIVACP